METPIHFVLVGAGCCKAREVGPLELIHDPVDQVVVEPCAFEPRAKLGLGKAADGFSEARFHARMRAEVDRLLEGPPPGQDGKIQKG